MLLRSSASRRTLSPPPTASPQARGHHGARRRDDARDHGAVGAGMCTTRRRPSRSIATGTGPPPASARAPRPAPAPPRARRPPSAAPPRNYARRGPARVEVHDLGGAGAEEAERSVVHAALPEPVGRQGGHRRREPRSGWPRPGARELLGQRRPAAELAHQRVEAAAARQAQIQRPRRQGPLGVGCVPPTRRAARTGSPVPARRATSRPAVARSSNSAARSSATCQIGARPAAAIWVAPSSAAPASRSTAPPFAEMEEIRCGHPRQRARGRGRRGRVRARGGWR